MIRSLLIAATVAAALTTGAQAQPLGRDMTSNEFFIVGFATNYCPEIKVSKTTMRRALYSFMSHFGVTDAEYAAMKMDILVLNEFNQFSDAEVRKMCRNAAKMVRGL